MSKKLLLFKSKWGSTHEYANMIKDALPEVDLADIDEAEPGMFDKYDVVVIGSRTYMGQIQVIPYLVENWEKFKTKKVYLFSVGIIPAESEESIKSYKAIPENIRNELAGYTKLPGRVKESNLNFFENLIFKSKKIQNPDKMDRNSIKPILEFLQKN